ncbi:MAG: HTTM domain-containing protein [Chitinophagaceae bacterium]|nr:HTTM domain-containing protein [Chitinophagaceae bacterium]
MFASIARFWYNGWINTLYVLPPFHFTYLGFEWVRPLGHTGMHLIFLCMGLSALMIMFGFLYRIATVIFFLCFTYVELIDVTTYLNHYYFISLVAFLLIWLPAHRHYSVDMRLWPHLRCLTVPRWCVGILRFQMAVVYVFAGIAKLYADWLFDAMPMRLWLPAKSHLPIVGPWMYELWVAYLFSWFGAVYDLFIAFFLLYRPTRPFAYFFVLVFHIATAIFFPAIGMFPFVMIANSLIFFSGSFHQRLQSFLPGYTSANALPSQVYSFAQAQLWSIGIGLYISFQLLFPFRYLLYPGHLFWHEEGYRFSWRVMLMEKTGNSFFTVKDSATQQQIEVNNAAFLTPLQEKMMSTQPDLIAKYAQHLAQQYQQRGMQQPQVYAQVYVSLNGQRSRLFVDTTVNLAAQKLGWQHYTWVLPYKP